MILTSIISGFVAAFVLFFLLLGVFYVAKRKFSTFLQSFVTASSPGLPSPLAIVIQQVAGVFATEISKSIKGTLMGIQSVESRNETAEQSAQLATQSPLLGAVLAAFPGVGKRLAKNPALATLALSMLNKKQNSSAILPGNGGSNQGNPFKF